MAPRKGVAIDRERWENALEIYSSKDRKLKKEERNSSILQSVYLLTEPCNHSVSQCKTLCKNNSACLNLLSCAEWMADSKIQIYFIG